MRRLFLIAITAIAGAAFLASSAQSENEFTYFIEADNVFGIVNGSEVKISGVQQGTVEELFINEDKRAVVKAVVTGPLAQLGEDSICSFEPQSLIAEYFIDCTSKGQPMEPNQGTDEERVENPDIPVKQTRQTVQNDLVASALRTPYKQRLRLLINEFGTALAGNPEELNSAILRGAPALTQARQLTKILGEQNTIIRDLNANSDRIFVELERNRADVREFVLRARDTAAASADRRDDLSQNFLLLDDFLEELRPTMARLNDFALAQTPLLRDLQASAPGLVDLSRDLPDFNEATTRSLQSLGDAGVIGKRALRKAEDEIDQLRVTSRNSFSAADRLRKLLEDMDDPNRAVAEDARAARDTEDPNRAGYTTLEGLLNYVYYQAGAINQFDQISHLLHFSIFEVESTPCSNYNAEDHVPSQDGGETTNFDEIHRCVAWLGPNQPGINQQVDIPKYDPAVCPEGSTDLSICDPNGESSATTPLSKRADAAEGVRGIRGGNRNRSRGSGGGGGGGDSGLEGGLENLPRGGSGSPESLRGQSSRSSNRPNPAATRDLLGFLLDN